MSIRSIISAIALIIFTFNSHSQDFSWGPKLGLSHSKVDQAFKKWSEFEDHYSENLGYHGGLFGRVTFSGLQVQAEALFHKTNREVSIKNIDPIESVNLNYTKINVPVLAGKKFFEFLRFNAGPVVNFHIRNDIDHQNGEDIRARFQDVALGGQTGMGFDFWQLIIDFKYQFGFQDLVDKIEVDGRQFKTDIKENFFLIELGWRFGIDD